MTKDNKDYLELRDEWYDILEDDPVFSDIEIIQRGKDVFCPLLKVSASNIGQRIERAELSNHIEYYQLVGHFLFENDWKSSLDREIWSQYAEGIVINQIAKNLELKTSLVKKRCSKIKGQLLKRYIYDN